jgi:hypothetical protein
LRHCVEDWFYARRGGIIVLYSLRVAGKPEKGRGDEPAATRLRDTTATGDEERT